jgi:hypothetical protein
MHTPDTSESEISIDYQLTIKDEISTFQRRLLKYRQVLNNDKAVWLFLTTLGCWSVTNICLQFAALLLTWIIFIKRLIDLSKDIKSFPKWKKSIEDRIAQSSLPEDSEKARRFELEKLEDVMSIRFVLKDGQVYFLCCLFYLLTFLNWGYRLHVLLHPLPKSTC